MKITVETSNMNTQSEIVPATIKTQVGRPTSYNDQVLLTAIDYLFNYKEHGQNVPTVARLAQLLELTEVTLYRWANDENKAEFSYTLERIKQAQKIELVENGLSGNYNSNITKLMLYNHGFSDKQEVTAQIETKDVGNNELARRLAFVLAKGVTIEGETE